MKHGFVIIVALVTVVMLFALDRSACHNDPNYGFVAQVITLAAITANCGLGIVALVRYGIERE